MANQNKYNFLVIGGGNAGLSFAAQLLRADSSVSVGIIEPSAVHYYQPAWTLVGGGTFDINKTKRQEKDFIPSGADWIKAKASTFQPDDNQVTLEDGRSIGYDILMVAPGIQLNWDGIPGLAETIGKNNVTSNYRFDLAPYTWELVQKTRKGQALFTQPATPIKCGGAPQKIMYLASDYWRKQGVLSKIDVDFYTPGSVIFGVEPFKAALEKVVKRYGINTHFKHNMVKIDGVNRTAWFEDLEHPDKEPFAVQYEMIHVVPPQSAPDFVKNSPLARPGDAYGWVDVDKYSLQHVKYANVFSVGDVAGTPNAKTGAAVRKQVPVAVQNALTVLKQNKLDDPAKYNGYGSCPLVTGYGKLILAEFDYEGNPDTSFPIDQGKERWSMYQLKKHVLPWLYWNKILKGTA